MIGQPDPRQQFGHALVDLAARQLAGQSQGQRDVIGHGLGGQQIEVLENHPDLLAEASQAAGVERSDFFAVDEDLAASGILQPIDQAQQSTFARAGVADQAKHLAVLNRQTGRVQGGNFLTGDAVGFVDVLKLDHVANLVGRVGKGSAVSRARILACPYRGS